MNPVKNFQILSLHLSVFCLLLTGELTAASFQQGIKAYEEARYAEAAQHFTAAIETEETAAARHNLALAHFQQGEPVQALWHLERALVLDPLNREYLSKRAALNEHLGLFGHDPRWYELAASALPFGMWLTLASLSAWVLLAALCLPRVGGLRVGLATQSLRWIAVVTLLIALPANLWHYRALTQGSLTATEPIALRAAPASAAPQIGAARPGERARALEKHEAFVRIQTETQQSGWVPASQFKTFREF